MPRFSSKITKNRKGVGGRGKKKQVGLIPTTSSLDVTPNPTSTKLQPTKVSSSTKKIDLSEYDNYNTDVNYKNEIIDISILSDILQENSLCKYCKKSGLHMTSVNNVGLASNLELSCKYCDFSKTFTSSKEVQIPNKNKQMFDVNIRLVYGLRCIGKGQTAGQTLCGILNLPQPPTKFAQYNSVLLENCKDIAIDSMTKAVEEAVEENKIITEEDKRTRPEVYADPRNISAGFDGTWQRRGHQSLNGVTTCTSIDNGKVMDVEIMSKHCICLDKNKHEDHCTANHKGSSGSMEGAGIIKIFSRSVERYDVRYTHYLGDGDCNSFDSVVASRPYGDIQIEKLECINHVMKRMGARLRRLKLESKNQKLDDGKSLGGKNRLTDKLIDKIQSYYGQAIKKHTDNLQEMRQAVWAIYCHIGSTDDKPEHRLCPDGAMSWCKYNKAKAENKAYSHTNTIPESIMTAIRPTFKALVDPNLLKKCLHGKTQNVNESVNSVIWGRIPKNTFVTLKTLSLGVYEAVASYNDGYITKCKVLHSLGIDPGVRTIGAMRMLDRERIRSAEKAVSDFVRQARRKNKLNKRKLGQDEEETPAYLAGMY